MKRKHWLTSSNYFTKGIEKGQNYNYYEIYFVKYKMANKTCFFFSVFSKLEENKFNTFLYIMFLILILASNKCKYLVDYLK